jgi:hypothetical protein
LAAPFYMACNVAHINQSRHLDRHISRRLAGVQNVKNVRFFVPEQESVRKQVLRSQLILVHTEHQSGPVMRKVNEGA